MSTADWIAFAGLLVAMIGTSGGTAKWLLRRIEDGDTTTKGELGAVLAKSDLDFQQFRDAIERDYLRIREYEVAQRNTDRRLESIEAKLDKIPDSLDRQSERLIAVLKDTRS